MPERPTITVHGLGGHGRVVISAALRIGWQVKQTDDSYGTQPEDGVPCIIAIGDNATRKRLGLNRSNLQRIVHPSAYIDASAQIGYGTFVGPGAVIHVAARVGQGAIINTMALVEHDCIVGDWVHIAPGAVLCGGVKIGEGTWIGCNAAVRENITIAPWCIIGAGSAVLSDITEAGTYVGAPARRVK